MNELFEAAVEYRRRGWHPIPCRPRDKRPLVRWQDYQTTPPTPEQITSWWHQWPDANVALVTGRGFFAVDLDGDGAEDLLWSAGIFLPDVAPRVKTGSGEHVYFAVSEAVSNRAALLSADGGKPQVDIRGDGGYVVAPPSIHPSGARYSWKTPPVFPMPPAPETLLSLLRQPTRNHAGAGPSGQDWVSTALAGVGEGQRDNTATRLAGYFLHNGLPEDVVCSILCAFAERCTPPLGLRDIVRIVHSVAQAERRNRVAEERTCPLVHIADAVDSVVASLHAGVQKGSPTGIGFLDRLTAGGFRPGEFVLLGARPGVGKTAIALQMARAAAKDKCGVLIVSREMVWQALTRRLLSQEGRVNASDLRAGTIRDWPAVNSAAQRLGHLPLWMTDAARTMQDIETAMQTMPQPCGMLIVDYLQLVDAPKEIKERRIQVESVSNSLKALALSRQIPVICLSSLSRPGEGREKRPGLASLRESGCLEHDADVVLLLHREQGKADTELVVAKNRDGEQGATRLVFKPEWVTFAELELEHEDERYR